jgi:hypothetical protein
MSRANCLAIIVAAGAISAPMSSHANGRFPASLDVKFQKDNDQLILSSMTFGLLVSKDDGATFEWICEDAINYSGNFNPDYEVADDGAIFATTNGRSRQIGEPDAGTPDPRLNPALRVSRDNGCTWNAVPGALANAVVGSVEIGPDGKVWAATAEAGKPNDVYISDNNGTSFSPTGLTNGNAFWRSLEVADADANRAYVTGLLPQMQLPMDAGISEREGLIYRTTNGGTNWEQLSTSQLQLGFGKDIYVLGTMPNDANTVFLRSVEAGGIFVDYLYRSTDGGDNWTKVLELSGYMVGFTITKAGMIIVGTLEDGVRISTDSGDNWTTPTQEPKMACVGERPADGDLFACGANWDPDFFSVGRSTDGAQTWQKVFRLVEIAKPLSCPPGTVQYDVCESLQWPDLKEMFGIGRPDAGPGMGDGGVTADAGNGGGDGKGCCNAAFLFVLPLMFWRRRRRNRFGDF